MLTALTIGNLVAGGLGSIYGAWKERQASNAAAEQLSSYENQEQQRISKDKEDNEAWYNREYYRNPLQNEESQAAMTSMREYLDEQNKVADSRAAITGSTAESRIAQRGQSAKAIGQLTRDLAAKGTAYKQSLQGQYWANKNHLSAQQGNLYSNINNAKMGIHGQQMQSANNTMSKGIDLMGVGLKGYFDSKK